MPSLDASIRHKLVDAQGTSLASDYAFVPGTALAGWVKIELPLRIAQPGTLYLEVVGQRLGRPVLFDDIAVRHRGGLIVQEQHQYPYGAPITGLSYTVGNRRYRHGYQGQYTETDTTTGWESFELRLYDAARARWSAPDPEGQFVSPYIAMGNNPVSGVDPNGGWSWSWAGASIGAVGGSLVGTAIAPEGQMLKYALGGAVLGGVAGGLLEGVGDSAGG